MDYRDKYLKCFFMWQNIYMMAAKRIKELEAEVKKLKELLNDKHN